MTKVDYWESLEFRVCHALREMPERRFQSLWCDGFIPNEYRINTAPPRIIGEVWICNGQKQSKWGFTLLLPRSFISPNETDWTLLLPPDDSIQWLLLDEDNRNLQIQANFNYETNC
jgi:hypothetical protein